MKKEYIKSVFLTFLKNWAIPIAILGFLLIFGSKLIQFFTEKMIKGFYKNILHPIEYSSTTTGEIGNTYGGTAGTIVALIASYLMFLAFWVQYRANDQQKKDLRIERFENKFYQMLQIHRNNVSEIKIGKSITGRKAFISIFSELRYCYLIANDFYQNNINNFPNIGRDEIFNVGYFIFFFGCGPNSNKINTDLFNDKKHLQKFYLKLEEELECHKTTIRNNKANLQCQPIKQYLTENLLELTNYDGEKHSLRINYIPFEGHMANLSHYIRHLFQLVKYVDEHYPDSNNYKAKHDYIATLRSQLSIYEQLFIYYNSLSALGNPWINNSKSNDENLLKKYTVLKSLPIPLASFYKTPEDIFGKETHNNYGMPLFEWSDIKNRINKI